MRHDLPFLLLDDSRLGRERLRVFENATRIIEAHDEADIPRAFAELEEARVGSAHVAGYFSYELGYALEGKLAPLMPAQRALPLLWFGVFGSYREITGADVASFLAEQEEGRAYAGRLRFSETQESYAKKFGKIKSYIASGDVYQVNLTFPASFAFAGDPMALYASLRAHSGAGHGAYLFDGTSHILSLSPELFFTAQEGVLTARPMKGTARRGANEVEDTLLRESLPQSEKERAENLMIVDLIRNDLGRVAEMGSVAVRDLFAVETYPTVHQMVSTVTARLRPHVSAEELVRAIFPCGSVTGTPKIRAQEIIKEYEETPRGIYCGAIGCFGPAGAADFNVAIRTLHIRGGEGVLGIGGGVVADSREEGEYQEALIKARFYSEHRVPITLIETLRFDPAEGLVRLALHVARLKHSASDLGLPFGEEKLHDALSEATGESLEPLRVRVELDEAGQFHLTTATLDANPQSWSYAFAAEPVQSGDVLLSHKTGWRGIYDEAFAKARASTGCDEVVLVNERGEVTEGSRTNIFVRLDGVLTTPPLSGGVLPGILRQSLLEQGACVERVVTPGDLERSDAVFLGNSLRGLIPARPVS